MTLCHHCRKREANRRRGLCHRCYEDKTVRAAAPVVSKYGRDGEQDFFGGYGQADAPTDVLPGAAKIAVLAARVLQRVALHHSQDARR